jgi:hypothetical protein
MRQAIAVILCIFFPLWTTGQRVPGSPVCPFGWNLAFISDFYFSRLPPKQH